LFEEIFNMDKKLIPLILAAGAGVLTYPLFGTAQLHSYGPGATIQQLFFGLENMMWIIFAGVVVVCFVVAGMLFLFAQGDPEKVKVARTAFIWGVVGVVVGILAYSILAIVTTVMSGGI